MNNANTNRLSDWRDRYRAAGYKYDIAAHNCQRVRGIAWNRRDNGRIALEHGFLPVRTVHEHFDALVVKEDAA